MFFIIMTTVIYVDRKYSWNENIRFNLNKENNNFYLSFILPQLSSNYKFIDDIHYKLLKHVRLYLVDIYCINFMMYELTNDEILQSIIINNNQITISLDRFNKFINNNHISSSQFYLDIKLDDVANIIIKCYDDYPNINLDPYDFKFSLHSNKN
jgi:hypothetical protein